jgi:hypothetical protein
MTAARTYSVSEIAEATGFSVNSVYRAIRDGRLVRFLVRDAGGRARLMPEAARAIRSGVLRPRSDSRPEAFAPAAAPAPAIQPDLEEVASWANALLLLPQWSAPPWDGKQWRTLAIVAAQAEDFAAEYGPWSESMFHQLEQEGNI